MLQIKNHAAHLGSVKPCLKKTTTHVSLIHSFSVSPASATFHVNASTADICLIITWASASTFIRHYKILPQLMRLSREDFHSISFLL